MVSPGQPAELHGTCGGCVPGPSAALHVLSCPLALWLLEGRLCSVSRAGAALAVRCLVGELLSSRAASASLCLQAQPAGLRWLSVQGHLLSPRAPAPIGVPPVLFQAAAQLCSQRPCCVVRGGWALAPVGKSPFLRGLGGPVLVSHRPISLPNCRGWGSWAQEWPPLLGALGLGWLSWHGSQRRGSRMELETSRSPAGRGSVCEGGLPSLPRCWLMAPS